MQFFSINSFMKEEIIVKGAKVHNLKNIDVNIPLNEAVAIAGVSGSGKSSLALGVLYAEGSRRYLESLSTYTRRRMSHQERSKVDDVLYIPAALALRQRPQVPGIRSTFGTQSELLNSLRLMFSRLSSHKCPNGHSVSPSINVAAEKELVCPICGEKFYAPSAEDLSFNSSGACTKCDGTGIVRTVDKSKLVPDENLTIEEGAVAPWNSLMWSLMVDVAREMGVRTNVPFKDLSDEEKDIVYNGPAVKKHIIYKAKSSNQAAELDFTYFNATYTVINALSKVKDEKGMKRVEKFLKEDLCPECNGSRLSEKAREPEIMGINLAQATSMTLKDLIPWVKKVPESLPNEMKDMAESIVESFLDTAKRLMDLGLSYLSLDRASSTLSNGERQRVQLARSVRNRTTGVLYVLDEPSIGLHPANLIGLKNVINDLISDGNSVVLVDHDTEILKCASHLIEMGPGSGRDGGYVIAKGSISEIENNEISQIGPYLSGKVNPIVRQKANKGELFKHGAIEMETDVIHTLKKLDVRIPKSRFTVVTGVSGSGKTTLVLESLAPALSALIKGEKLPAHVKNIKADGIKHVKLIDASPIGINIRSTVATYSGVHDEMRKLFASTKDAKEKGYKAGDFSYNTGSLRCPECDGTGTISLDVQFLADVNIECPSCHGSRYSKEANDIRYGNYSISELMEMDTLSAKEALKTKKSIVDKLTTLDSLGLGYLTLSEETPALSGGEAQRLKLSSEMGKSQSDSLFIFDEPTIGLHPKDVESLIAVFDSLIKNGATLVVIEHDLNLIKNADYIIDMGPGGGRDGGEIVFSGFEEDIKECKESVTALYL